MSHGTLVIDIYAHANVSAVMMHIPFPVQQLQQIRGRGLHNPPQQFLIQAMAISRSLHVKLICSIKQVLCRKTEELVEKLKQPPEGSSPLKFTSRYSRGLIDQFRLLLLRNSREYWRMPDYNTVRVYFTCLFGLVLGAVYWRIGTERWA